MFFLRVIIIYNIIKFSKYEFLSAKIDRSTVIRWLSKLLSSPKFIVSHKHQKLLRYLVENMLDGNGDRLKGYSIGVEALGRPADFDPNQDAIVRVEAHRLRAKLSKYYQGSGAKDEVHFHILKGSYQVVFHVKSDLAESNDLSNRGIGDDRRNEREFYAIQTPMTIAANMAYLRGLAQQWQMSSASMHAAKELFLLALECDPNHALAHAWLSRTLIYQWSMLKVRDDGIVELAQHHAAIAQKLNLALEILHSLSVLSGDSRFNPW